MHITARQALSKKKWRTSAPKEVCVSSNYTRVADEQEILKVCMRGGVLVVRRGVLSRMVSSRAREANIRGVIRKFSTGAARRMRAYLRSCVPVYVAMVTLTYPQGFPGNGPLCKSHLRALLSRIKRLPQFRNNATSSVFWFMEFQERGAPHFHMFTTDWIDKDWLRRAWYEIVASEDKRHYAAGTRIERFFRGHSGIAAYATKYAYKEEQKVVPPEFDNVGRFWGVSGCRVCVSADTVFVGPSIHAEDTKRHLDSLIEEVKATEMSGGAKVFREDSGAFVAMIWNPESRSYAEFIMAKLCLVSAARSDRHLRGLQWIFEDAEVDNAY